MGRSKRGGRETKRRKHLRFNRKKKFINPGFQLRYMAYLVGLMTLFFLVIFGCFYLGIWDGILEGLSLDALEEQKQLEAMKNEPWIVQQSEVALSMYLGSEEGVLSQSQQQVFHSIFQKTNEKLFPVLALYLVLVIFIARLITFRVAGPLFRIQADINHSVAGDLSKRIRLRKGDHCVELAGCVNKLLENFDLTIENLKKIARDYEHTPDIHRMMKSFYGQIDQFETSGDVERKRERETSDEAHRREL